MVGRIPRRAAKVATALLASTALVAVAAGTASADSGIGQGPGGANTGVKYTATYTDPLLGPITCTGTHQTNKKYYPGTATEGGRDVFRCKSTEAKTPLKDVAAGEEGESNTGFPGATAWNSDYFFNLNSSTVPAKENTIIPAKALAWKVSANGMVVKAVAYY
jgi:hypothetical protein